MRNREGRVVSTKHEMSFAEARQRLCRVDYEEARKNGIDGTSLERRITYGWDLQRAKTQSLKTKVYKPGSRRRKVTPEPKAMPKKVKPDFYLSEQVRISGAVIICLMAQYFVR